MTQHKNVNIIFGKFLRGRICTVINLLLNAVNFKGKGGTHLFEKYSAVWEIINLGSRVSNTNNSGIEI